MNTDFSPSVNIVRDADRPFHYIPTANSQRVYNQILNDYALGIRAFSMIGSYGTGKSAFLLAFERTLTGRHLFFPAINGEFKDVKEVQFVNIIGSFSSLEYAIRSEFDIPMDKDLFIGLDRVTRTAVSKKVCIVLVIDEFGKFLEYAAETNPKREMYFIQQFAEYANDPAKNFLLISVLHQSFNAYSARLAYEDREEWTKVKGRFKEITFNEPVEQLLALAADYVERLDLPRATADIEPLVDAIRNSKSYPHVEMLTYDFARKLRPFDLLSASVLTQALQIYGQNERSLFTFLNANEHLGLRDYDAETTPFFNITCVHDYLVHNYHAFLSTAYNPHHSGWGAIRSATERVDAVFDQHRLTALKLVKTIGLLNIFAPAGSRINTEFLSAYADHALGCADVELVLDKLQDYKIIRHVAFKDTFILFEGTDLDIDEEILNAGSKIDAIGNIIPYLQRYFQFPYLSAKAVSYRTGSPRFFEYRLTEELLEEIPEGVIDGFINLVFSETLTEQALLKISKQPQNHATLYAWYRDSRRIRTILFEIEKVNYVMEKHPDDRVALRQLQDIKEHEIKQLNQYVLDNLVSGDKNIVWVSRGEIHHIVGRKALNQLLSIICDIVYSYTPTFRNELMNRHQVSSAAATARKHFFKQLVIGWNESELGFPAKKFPAEKTLYLSLLKKTSIHREDEGKYLLGMPTDETFVPLWSACEQFLEDSKVAPKQVVELVEILESAPFKLKQGLIDIWVPLYIFIRRESLALYHQDVYVPLINDATLDLLRKSPQRFQVKAYVVDGVRQRIFNRVRLATAKEIVENVSSTALIETVGEFIGFYRQLPDYTKHTSRLDPKTRSLRDALATAKEPDTTFFEDLPRALGFANLDDENVTDEVIDAYVQQLAASVKELTQSYDLLVNRIEEHLLSVFNIFGLIFPEYRADIREHYSPLRVHMLLPKQRIFYTRLMSPINDRLAWLGSLVQAVVGKQMHRLRDEDEIVVFDNLTEMIRELDNLCMLEKIAEEVADKEIAVRVEITTLAHGSQSKTVRMPLDREKEIIAIEQKIRSALSSDKEINVSALTRILEKEMGG